MTAQDDLMNAPLREGEVGKVNGVRIYMGGRGGGSKTHPAAIAFTRKLVEHFELLAIDETTPKEPKMAKGIQRSTANSRAGRSMYNIAKPSRPDLISPEQRAWNEKVEQRRLDKKAGKK